MCILRHSNSRCWGVIQWRVSSSPPLTAYTSVSLSDSLCWCFLGVPPDRFCAHTSWWGFAFRHAVIKLHRCWLRVRHFETPLTQTQTVGFWTWTWRKLCEFSLDSEYWNLSFCRNARKSLAQACRLGLFNCRKLNGVKQIAVIWLFHHCVISAKILKLHVLKIVLIRFLMFSFFFSFMSNYS